MTRSHIGQARNRLAAISTGSLRDCVDPDQGGRSMTGASYRRRELGAFGKTGDIEMRAINPVKAGVALGLVMGLFHLAWAVLVAIGWAQPIIDFVLKLHFIQPFVQIQPFDPATAASLVGLTAAVGFVIGAALALAWNQLHPADQ